MKLLHYLLFFFIVQTSLLYASEDDNTSITLYTPSSQPSFNNDGCAPTPQQVAESSNDSDPLVATNPGGNDPNPGPGDPGNDASYMSAAINLTQALMNTDEYQKARSAVLEAHKKDLKEFEDTLISRANAIVYAILSQNMFEALLAIQPFNMPDNLPSALVKATNEFNSKFINMLFNKSGNADMYGAPRNLDTINPHEVCKVYTDYINKLGQMREVTVHIKYNIYEGIKYSVVPPESKAILLSNLNKHPALNNIQVNDRWWTPVIKFFSSFVDNPNKVSDSFDAYISGNRYTGELRTMSFQYKNGGYQDILNRLNEFPELDQAYPTLRPLVQEALKQKRINDIIANPDLAYQYTATTQPLLTTSTTAQAAPINPTAQQEVSGEAIAQQQAPINDELAQSTVFEQTSTQKISFSAEAMQRALAQAASELEDQKSDIIVRFSPRMGQLVFNLKSQQPQTSTPATLTQQQAKSSTPVALVQTVDILSPAAQELLNSCGLTSLPVHDVAPEHQPFIQKSEVVLNNATQAYQDNTASDAAIAEVIVLTRAAQELELAGQSDKATILLTIAERKLDGHPVPVAQNTGFSYMDHTLPTIYDEYEAEAAAFSSYGRVFNHAGQRIWHNVKHPGEFATRQVDGLKNLTLLSAKSLNTIAKFLSEDPDLGREACQEAYNDLTSAAHAIASSVKHIVNMSEHEREEFFGQLIGDGLVDMVGLKGLGKVANTAQQAARWRSSTAIEGAAQTFKGNKPLVPLYENAVKKIPKPAPLEVVYDPKTNSWRVPNTSSSISTQKSTGIKVPQTYKPGTRMTPTRPALGAHKMPPPPPFTLPRVNRQKTAPAIAASSSAGQGQTVGKVNAPVASSSGAGQPANTTQQPLATPSNVSTPSQTGTTPGTGIQNPASNQAPAANPKNFVEVKGYQWMMPAQTAQFLIQADPLLEAIRADILTIAQQYDLTRTGFTDFATKYIKLTYEHILAPEFGVQRGGNVKLTGFHHDMNGTIEQSGIIRLIDRSKEDKFGCYSGRPVFNGQTLGKKTFFPQSWSREKVISKIFEAYDNYKISEGIPKITERGTYTFDGYTSEGVPIYFDITKNGVINTCYPKVALTGNDI